MVIDLTIDEVAAIAVAARPIPRDLQSAFKQAVAAALASVPERGPGVVHRIIREAQRSFLDPPRVA
jgi:hypothetical protein